MADVNLALLRRVLLKNKKGERLVVFSVSSAFSEHQHDDGNANDEYDY
jgi:hypothetical protein